MSNQDNLTEAQVEQYLKTFLSSTFYKVKIDGQIYDPVKDILGDLYNGFSLASGSSNASQRSCYMGINILFSSSS